MLLSSMEIGNHFFVEQPKREIHPTAIIHLGAKIGKNVTIGPYCVIGKAVIGDNTIIESHVKISSILLVPKQIVTQVGGSALSWPKPDLHGCG